MNRGLNRGLKVRGTMAKKQNAQKEVLHLLTEEFLTVKQIAIRRKTSNKAVYKIIKKLQKKGFLKGGLNRGLKKPIHPSKKNLIRLHGQEFNIKLLYKFSRYEELRKRSNTIIVGGNTIRLYSHSLEIYGNNAIFYGITEKEAYSKSMAYWFKFFNRLENELKIIIVKDRSRNIKEVNAHYSEIDNELAKECDKTKEKIDVKATKDGKTWFKIDNSFNLHELETLHPETGKEDMGEVVRPFFNDLRDNRPLKVSQIVALIAEITDLHKETASGLKGVVDLMKPKKEIKPKIKLEKRPSYIG